MQVRVQFFSQLKEVAGASELVCDMVEGATVSDLLRLLYERLPGLRKWDANILIGAGVEFVGRDHQLRADEEIAVMPPVQGG